MRASTISSQTLFISTHVCAHTKLLLAFENEQFLYYLCILCLNFHETCIKMAKKVVGRSFNRLYGGVTCLFNSVCFSPKFSEVKQKMDMNASIIDIQQERAHSSDDLVLEELVERCFILKSFDRRLCRFELSLRLTAEISSEMLEDSLQQESPIHLYLFSMVSG